MDVFEKNVARDTFNKFTHMEHFLKWLRLPDITNARYPISIVVDEIPLRQPFSLFKII